MPPSVKQLLVRVGLGDFSHLFEQEQVMWEDLPELTDGDLKELGIPMGPRKRLLKAIATLGDDQSEGAEPGRMEAARPERAQEAERRQLTVMFCDLVGSTQLGQKMDPEDYREVNRAYQDACKTAIERYEGYVARYMGDGVLAYFGYPNAHEDDAVRALHSGLGVIDSVRHLATELPQVSEGDLAVRIGVATGLVVVGDLIGEGSSKENPVVGETPNLAARLQGLAEPNTMVIGEVTHELAGGLFHYESLGKHEVKGIEKSVEAYRVGGTAKVESQYAATRQRSASSLFGREVEVALLADRWQLARDGEGQVITLSGEAGIGKSRITQEAIDLAKSQDSYRLNFQCSPYHANTAFFPIIEQMERSAEIDPTDPPSEKLQKLESILIMDESGKAKDVELLAGLLSIPLEGRYPELNLTAEQRKEKTFEALISQVNHMSRQKPLLIVFEDLHWIDPTSFELLEQLVEQSNNARILLIATFRPEFTTSWNVYTHITSLALNRLSQNTVTTMIADLTGGKQITEDLAAAIVEKTDGIPLFVEEMTKNILETEMLAEEPDKLVISDLLERLDIPITLQDSLMARLDRLGGVKEVAQQASALGREFSYDLLAAISDLDAGGLQRALDQLVDAELVFQSSRVSRGNYIFKHALVQDVAYSSMLNRIRRELHSRIAMVLDSQFPEMVENRPELLAHHYTEAAMVPEATAYWLKAGRFALTRSANREAVAHLNKGLDLVRSQDGSEPWLERELDLLLELTSALTATAGYAANETETACVRALQLCQRMGDPDELFRAFYAVWCVYYIRPEMEKAFEFAGEFLGLDLTEKDRDRLVVAHSAMGHTCTTMGRYEMAREHFEQAIDNYDREQDDTLAIEYGEHPGIGSKIVSATVDWMSGYPDRALELAEANLKEAFEISHPNTYAWAGVTLAMINKDRRDRDRTRESANRILQFTTENRIPYWRAQALVLLGWALVDGGDLAGGIAAIEEGREAGGATGSGMRAPDTLSVHALACLKDARPEDGLEKTAEAISLIKQTGERWNEANVHNIQGVLHKALEQFEHAEQSFQQAIEIARLQGAKSYELRASTQLARLWVEQEKEQQAADLLSPVYNWFSEGWETRDLVAARDLLDKLA